MRKQFGHSRESAGHWPDGEEIRYTSRLKGALSKLADVA